MSTITITETIDVDRPADDAWRVVADYARDTEWRTGVVAMTPTPAGLVRRGTTTAEELRLAGRSHHTTGVVTAVDPGRTFSWRTTDGADASGRRTVTPLGDGRCRVELHLAVRLHGAERLLRPLFARMLRRNLRTDAGSLRCLVEQAPRLAGDPVG